MGDNTDGGAVMLRPIRFLRTGVWNSAGTPSFVGANVSQGVDIVQDDTDILTH